LVTNTTYPGEPSRCDGSPQSLWRCCEEPGP
jgi:hypothetical protein